MNYPLIFVFLMALAMLIYVVLDGYDLGVGILLRRADDAHKDEMIASIGPFCAAALSSAASSWALSPTSAAAHFADAPSCAQASSSSAARRAISVTRPPSATIRSAVARPIPVDAPVMTTWQAATSVSCRR